MCGRTRSNATQGLLPNQVFNMQECHAHELLVASPPPPPPYPDLGDLEHASIANSSIAMTGRKTYLRRIYQFKQS